MPLPRTSVPRLSAGKARAQVPERQPFKEDELQCLKSHLEAWSATSWPQKPSIFSAIYREGKLLGPKLDGRQWKKRKAVSICDANRVLLLICYKDVQDVVVQQHEEEEKKRCDKVWKKVEFKNGNLPPASG